MKAYKGFDKNMQCRGFQYEEGKEYETDVAKLCESGFHACEMPLNCFDYYAPAESVYHVVELDATDEKSNDTKRVGAKIKIGARLTIANIIKAQFEYIKERCTNTKNGGDWSALNGGNQSALNGGDWSALNGGNQSALNGGNQSALNGGYWSALNGGYQSALNGGDCSALNGGDCSALNGGYRSALNGGDCSALNGGDWSALNGGNRSALNGGNQSALNGGNQSALNGGNQSALNGGDCSALNGGDWSVLRGGTGSKFKGGMWAVFACEMLNDDGEIIGMKTAVVDGETIKPGVWYTLKNGEFVETEGE